MIISFFRYVDYLVLYHLYWHFVLNMVSNRIKENHLLKEEEELDDVDLKKKKDILMTDIWNHGMLFW